MRTVNGITFCDTIDEMLDPRRSAVVVVDVQNDFCSPEGHFAHYGKDVGETGRVARAAAAFVHSARNLGIRIVFVQQITLPDGKSDSPAWMRLKTRDGKSPDYALPGSWGAQLSPGLEPKDGDLHVTKFRPDAFVHTELDFLLRSNGIETCVILGTTTEGCIESTVRSASYHDYYVVVLADLVASPNHALHEGSLDFMRARYLVHTASEVLAMWESAAPKTRP